MKKSGAIPATPAQIKAHQNKREHFILRLGPVKKGDVIKQVKAFQVWQIGNDFGRYEG